MEEPCERIPYSEMCISGEHFSTYHYCLVLLKINISNIVRLTIIECSTLLRTVFSSYTLSS